MYYLILQILNIDYKEDIMLALQSVGLQKGTSLDAVNLDSPLSMDLPMFTGFFRTEDDKARQVQLITAYLEDTSQARDILKNLRQAGIDIDKEEILHLAVLPLALWFDPEQGLLEKPEK